MSLCSDTLFEFPAVSVRAAVLRPREALNNTTSSEGEDVEHQPGPALPQSAFLGVSWDNQMRKWQATLTLQAKNKHVGPPTTPKRASTLQRRQCHTTIMELRASISQLFSASGPAPRAASRRRSASARTTRRRIRLRRRRCPTSAPSASTRSRARRTEPLVIATARYRVAAVSTSRA